jgi:hypothetical protein
MAAGTRNLREGNNEERYVIGVRHWSIAPRLIAVGIRNLREERGALRDQGTTLEHRTQVNRGRNTKPAGGKQRRALRDQGTTLEHRTRLISETWGRFGGFA